MLPLLFSLAAALVVTTIITNYFTSFLVARAGRRVAQTQAVIDRLEHSVATVTDAETGQRGYLLTGDSKYLDPYHKALGEVDGDLAALQADADLGEISRDDVAKLRQPIKAKLDELDQTIRLKQKNQSEAALAVVLTDAGKNFMDAIRSQVTGLIRFERIEMDGQRRWVVHMDRLRTVVLIVAACVNVAFLGWAFGRLRREMAAHEASALEVLRQKDLLAVTLASIGDAVIVTDPTGRITFLNDIAERLTGWPLADASGLPLSEVFKVINEQSRLTVESPVDKVLRLGAVVGLANHTLLIRRDGTEVPIDDSGAPIREPDGTLRGVVLVFRDFSDHKEAEQRLQQGKNDLEVASRAKDQFLATLSHELRTPLTPVLAMLDSWENVSEVPPALRADVQVIRRNIELEARLIDDLLDVTRIVRGKLPVQIEEVDVHELIEAVVKMCRGDAEARQIELSLSLDGARHHARADPARLQQVLWNVLKNAIKFTPEGGHVRMASSNDPQGGIEVTCIDDGIGMDEQTLARLFRPFEQGTEETARRFGGLGLGLAISRGLIEAQDGSISAASDGLGKGSKIVIRIPSVRAPVAAARRADGSADGAAATRSTRAGNGEDARKLSILLVEDHVDTAQVMSRLLRRFGHDVQTSGTVAEAAELARKARFDLMLSDIGLPDGTGIDLIRLVRAHHEMAAIALTGFGMEEDIAKCLEAGFSAHLTKPIDFQNLEKMLNQVAEGEGKAWVVA